MSRRSEIRLLKTFVAFALVLVFSVRAAGQKSPRRAHEGLVCGGSWVGGQSYDSGPEFTVRLSFRTDTHSFPRDPTPEEKVLLHRIELEPGRKIVTQEIVSSAKTNLRGVAQFNRVPSGHYIVTVEGKYFPEHQAEVNVDASTHTSPEIDLWWPEVGFTARELRGRLVLDDSTYEKPEPLGSAPVQLIDGRSGKMLERHDTNPDGSYEFMGHGPGLYILRFSEDTGPGSRRYEIGLEIGATALEESIPTLTLGDVVCNDMPYPY